MTKETTTTDKAPVKARFIIAENISEGKYPGKVFRKNEQGQRVKDEFGLDLSCVFKAKETQATLKGYIDILPKLNPDFVALYSVPITPIEGEFFIAPVRAVESVQKNHKVSKVIARTSDNLMYAEGAPGIFPIDMDDCPRGKIEERTQAIRNVIPKLNQYSYGHIGSSSSLTYDENDNEITYEKGRRVFFMIDDASKMKQCAEIINDRLVLAGHGHIDFAADGHMMERGYIDTAIYKVSQPDYIGGAVLVPGDTQDRTSHYHEGQKGDLVPASIFKPLTKEEKAKVKAIYAAMKRQHQAESDRRKEAWKASRTDAERAMYEAWEQTQTLSLDWTVYDMRGEPVTVRQMRDNAGEYMGQWFYDPIAGKHHHETGALNNRAATLRKDDRTGQFYIQSFKGGNRKYLIESDKKQAGSFNNNWRQSLLKTKSGDIDNTSIVNAAIITKVLAEKDGGTLRWNEFTDAPEVDGSELSDVMCRNMRYNAELLVDYYRLSKENLAAGISVSAQKDKFHPITEWFSQLPVWDGVERVDTLLIRHGGVEDTPINRKMMRMWMISCVAAVHIVPCKIDTALYLWEPLGGTGKSTFFESLCPDKKYFLVMNKDISSDSIYEQFRGKWLIEMPEMAALRKSDAERTKTFITTRTDKYRIPYEQFASDHHRQCVLNVSANGPDLANDPALQRRFFPMEINAVEGRKGTKKQIDNPEILKERDQLWAEALYYFKKGEKWHVPDNDPLFDELGKVQASAAKPSTFADNLSERLYCDPRYEHRERISLSECCEILGFKNPSKQLRGQVKDEMNKVSGWSFVNPGNRPIWVRDEVSLKSISQSGSEFFDNRKGK